MYCFFLLTLRTEVTLDHIYKFRADITENIMISPISSAMYYRVTRQKSTEVSEQVTASIFMVR
jgi:hypothetical protein